MMQRRRAPPDSVDLLLHIDRSENPVRWFSIWFLAFVGTYKLAGDILATSGTRPLDEAGSHYLVSVALAAVLFLCTRQRRVA